MENWTDPMDFLEKLAVKAGRLLKKGEPDIGCVAKMVLNDWQRGKLPFYIVPAGYEIPLSKQNQEQSEEKTAEPETNETEKEEKEDKPEAENLAVLQDFTKIRVGLTFDESTDSDLIKTNKVEKLQLPETDSSLITSEYSDSDEEPGSDDDSSSVNAFDSEDEVPKKKQKIKSTSNFIVSEVDEHITKPVKKLTAKQKRAIERAQKPKKTGNTFYDYANVKNRNRNKKKK